MYQQLDRLSITELSLLSANINLNLGFLRDSYLSISDHVHAVVLHVSVLILSFASAATWRLRPTWLLQQLVCGVHDLPEKLQAARNPTAMVLWRQVRNSTTWCRCRRERHWIPYQLAIAVYKCMRWYLADDCLAMSAIAGKWRGLLTLGHCQDEDENWVDLRGDSQSHAQSSATVYQTTTQSLRELFCFRL